MNSESKITAAATAPLSSAQVCAPEWQPDPRGFAGTLFHLMEELDLRYCFLAEPYTNPGALISALEMTVHSEDRACLPMLFQKLGERGYLPLQCLPLAANDCRYDFAGSLDAGMRLFSLTIREAYPKGRLFTTDGEILTRRRRSTRPAPGQAGCGAAIRRGVAAGSARRVRWWSVGRNPGTT